VSSVASCDACGRPLCVTCAVPVRGTTIGPECLATVLEEPPPSVQVPAPLPPRGEWPAIAGFGLVVALGILPWSKVGEGSRLFGAWAPNWSLLAASAGLAGLAIALLARYRPMDQRLETAAYAVLGALVAVGSVLHLANPPFLSEASASPLLALAGAALALFGAGLKATRVVRDRSVRG
jgi:hypothetical protein